MRIERDEEPEEEKEKNRQLGDFEAHTPTENDLERETYLRLSEGSTELEGERPNRRRRGRRKEDGVDGGGRRRSGRGRSGRKLDLSRNDGDRLR